MSGAAPTPLEIGRSRAGRPLHAYRFGNGPLRISLLAGCHADEPVGPALLRRFVRELAALPMNHPRLATHEYWIVPHANPDGEARNRAWCDPLGETVDVVEYLRGVVREAPGDDVEFGFPRSPDDIEARPENRALTDWWRTATGPFDLHASLHGMAVAEGPWFLVEGAWQDRITGLMDRCAAATRDLGYRLHDVDRRGEKGFVRLGPGFTTRPDSRPMIEYFRARGDDATAALFRPTSMETIRSLGGDPLTLVSEMPLFLLPPRATDAPSTSADLQQWKERLGQWAVRLTGGDDPQIVRGEVAATGLRAMSVRDQMQLQMTLIEAGIEVVEGAR